VRDEDGLRRTIMIGRRHHSVSSVFPFPFQIPNSVRSHCASISSDGFTTSSEPQQRWTTITTNTDSETNIVRRATNSTRLLPTQPKSYQKGREGLELSAAGYDGSTREAPCRKRSAEKIPYAATACSGPVLHVIRNYCPDSRVGRIGGGGGG
jgi:hypothetical protein